MYKLDNIVAFNAIQISLVWRLETRMGFGKLMCVVDVKSFVKESVLSKGGGNKEKADRAGGGGWAYDRRKCKNNYQR